MAAIALVSCDDLLQGHPDNELLARVLQWRGHEVEVASWSDPSIDWAGFDLAVLRTVWDYSTRYEEFLRWLAAFPGRLLNPPAMVRWNSDKRYLADLGAAGLPVVPTQYVPPGADPPAFGGEVVVKPTVSAGARLTGRFSPARHAAAGVLLEAIGAVGRTAMVQPYLSTVDTVGETDLVLFDGVFSHALRKRQVLQPDEVAPTAGPGGPAAAMLDPGLVRPTMPAPQQIALAEQVRDFVADRFGSVPLVLRVDLVEQADGPLVLEVEAIEPDLSFGLVPNAVPRLADAIEDRMA